VLYSVEQFPRCDLLSKISLNSDSGVENASSTFILGQEVDEPMPNNIDDPHPQDNENTGKYGKGIIAKQYTSGSVIDIEVLLTTNHMGYFNFRYVSVDFGKWIF
jgi:hypothetical protein